MRVLIINKFLYPNGGSETYIFKLGEALEQHGHEVQYFGMEHEGRCVGNRVNAYTSDIPMKQSFRQNSLNWCRGFWKPKHAGRTMPKRWPCLQAFFTAGTAAVGWCADQPAIRANGISIISAPAASRTKAAARAIICGMKNSITSCGTRFRCRSRS